MQLTNVLVRIRGALAAGDPEVAQTLQLSDTQQLRIRDITRRSTASLRNRFRKLLGNSDTPSLRSTLQELRKESEQDVESILTAEQRHRLKQLRDGKSSS